MIVSIVTLASCIFLPCLTGAGYRVNENCLNCIIILKNLMLVLYLVMISAHSCIKHGYQPNANVNTNDALILN